MPLLPPPVPSPRPSPRVSRSGSHEPLAALVANGPHLPETTATTATPASDRMRSQNSDNVSLTSISSRTSRGNGNTPNVSENRRPSGASNQRSSSPSGSVSFGLDNGEVYYSPPADADEIPDGNQSPGTADLDDVPHFQQQSAASNRNSSEALAPPPPPVDYTAQRGRSSTSNSLEVVDCSSLELRPPPPHVHRHVLQGPCAELDASGALTASVEEPWEMVSHSHVDPANMICTETRALSARNPSDSPALLVVTPTRSPPPLNSKQDAANPNQHRRAKFRFFNINIFGGGHRHRQQNAVNSVGATANSNSPRPSLPCQPPLHSTSTEASPPHPPARPAHAPSAAAGVGAELPRNSLPTNNLNPNFVRGIHQGGGGGRGGGMEPLLICTDLAPPRPPPRPNHGPCPHTAAVAEGSARNGPLVDSLRASAGAGNSASSSASANGGSRAPPYPQQTYLPARQPYPPPPHSYPLPPSSASVGPASSHLQSQVSCPPALDHAAQQQLQQLRGVRRLLLAALACTCTLVEFVSLSHAPLSAIARRAAPSSPRLHSNWL